LVQRTRAKQLWNSTTVRQCYGAFLSGKRVFCSPTSGRRRGQPVTAMRSPLPQLVEFTEDDIEDIYRGEADFVPSLSPQTDGAEWRLRTPTIKGYPSDYADLNHLCSLWYK
jgi:hypothetical protein